MACWLLPCVVLGQEWAEIRIDATKASGTIRPLHGVNGGPLHWDATLDLSSFHRAAGFPHVRLHDCNWPNPDVVDMHAVFPNPEADPSLPESYDFARTDEYVNAVLASGSKIIFRLGESIEHNKARRRYVHPPRDMKKWAEVCVGIIRHYNEGWAKGFKHNIEYWEIWNEPDNRPAMWSGTDEDYLRLYTLSARAIKERFPKLKVGGPGLGNSGDLKGDRLEPTPFLKRFLGHCQKEAVPLDFLSWHVYTADPDEVIHRAKGIRRILDTAGFKKTESHLNEWNYLPENSWRGMLSRDVRVREKWHEELGGMDGAVISASTLMLLQDAPPRRKRSSFCSRFQKA